MEMFGRRLTTFYYCNERFISNWVGDWARKVTRRDQKRAIERI